MIKPQEPGGRTSAPPPLDIVQSFLNSVDLEDGPDVFATTEGLARWIREHVEIEPFAPTEADRTRVIDVREALREILTEQSDAGDAKGPVERLGQALDGVSCAITFDDTFTPRLVERGDTLDAVLATLMRVVYTASIDGTWQRLKVCRNDACRWAFYDASKNRSGVWCTMAICGSKMKTRSYRKRTQTSPHAGKEE